MHLETQHAWKLSGTVRRSAFCLGCALVLVVYGTVAHAQVTGTAGACELPASRMHYEVARVGGAPGEWTQAMRTTALRDVERVRGIVSASPQLVPLHGYRVQAALNTGLPGAHPNLPAEGANAPLPAYFVLRLFGQNQWQGACGLKQGATADATVAVVANVLGMLLEDEKSPLLSDTPQRFYLEPEIVRKVGGYPQYRNGTVLITRAGRAPLVHVTQEQWLRAVIAMFQHVTAQGDRDLAQEQGNHVDAGAQADTAAMMMDGAIATMEQMYEMMKSTDPKGAAEMKKSIEKMRAEQPAARANAKRMHALQPSIEEQRGKAGSAAGQQLDSTRTTIRTIEAYLRGLTPAQRRADAYYGPKIEYGYTVPSPGPDDHRIVMLNPNYFDRAGSRVAFQVLGVVSTFQGGSSKYERSPADQFAEQVLQSIDYARLAALIAK